MRHVIAAALLLASAAIALAQRPQPGVICARISVVPIDVRVVDRKGNPVTDLKQEDFTVLEDGVPQPIQRFELQTLSPDPAAATAAVDLRAPGSSKKARPTRRASRSRTIRSMSRSSSTTT